MHNGIIMYCKHNSPEGLCTQCNIEKVLLTLNKDKDEEILKLLNSYKNTVIFGEERNKKFNHLRNFLGDDDLKLYIIKSLRSMADELEKQGNLDIVFAELPKREPPAKGSTMDYIEVMISYPWGG